MNLARTSVFFVATLLCATVSPAEEIPHITGESLSSRQVDFPAACGGNVCIIVIGFSHGSQVQMKAWTDRANAEFHNNPNVAIYSVAVLEDAPRLVRGMAVHGIKSGVPAGQRDRFVIVYEGEAELKRVARFQKADAAYVLLLDRKGHINWVASGAVSEILVAELKGHLQSSGGE